MSRLMSRRRNAKIRRRSSSARGPARLHRRAIRCRRSSALGSVACIDDVDTTRRRASRRLGGTCTQRRLHPVQGAAAVLRALSSTRGARASPTHGIGVDGPAHRRRARCIGAQGRRSSRRLDRRHRATCSRRTRSTLSARAAARFVGRRRRRSRSRRRRRRRASSTAKHVIVATGSSAARAAGRAVRRASRSVDNDGALRIRRGAEDAWA
ncbi:MAG: hypothetical protein MZW92_34125 [Comamonadaceae bacterium]|nr:hypothetical protein [Comamonadaceae bacterium]